MSKTLFRKIIFVFTFLSGFLFVLLLIIFIQMAKEIKPENKFSDSSHISAQVQPEVQIREIPQIQTETQDSYYESDTIQPDGDSGEAALPPIYEAFQIKDVPMILQNPELPRGCEVTALCMLMNFYGIETDKMILAEEIEKDTTPREIKNGKTYWGNPDKGFIGDMYNINRPGYGVYHTPIFNLLSRYEPERAEDITGCGFDGIKRKIQNNSPVWAIVNTTYAPLPDSSFRQWRTPDGDIKITYREHAVVITGYDERFVYLNDPLFSKTKADIESFIECWEQMGAQAVTINEPSQ